MKLVSLLLLPALLIGGVPTHCHADIGLSTRQASATYDALIKSATDLLGQNKAPEAFEAALKATTLDPSRWEGYFYCAVAHYRQDLLDSAEEFARKAKERAPQASQAVILETLTTIADKHRFLSLVASAEKAESDGLRAKAAADYSAAWRLFRNRSDIGMKAVRLWRALQEWKECALIAQAIAATKEDANAEAALTICTELTSKINEMVVDLMNKAVLLRWANKIEEADSLLSQAIEVNPARYEPKLLLGLLRVTATTDKAKVSAGWPLLSQAVARGNLQVENFFDANARHIAKRKDLMNLAKAEAFQALVRETLGPSSVEKITPALSKLTIFSRVPEGSLAVSPDYDPSFGEWEKMNSEGDIPRVRLYANLAADLRYFNTGMAHAIVYGRVEAAEALLDSAYDLATFFPPTNGYQRLDSLRGQCAMYHQMKILHLLDEYGAHFNLSWDVTMPEDLHLVIPHLGSKANVGHIGPLGFAAVCGDVEMVNYLLTKGLDPNKTTTSQTLYGYTYLQILCKCSDPKIKNWANSPEDGLVQSAISLVRAGAKINAIDESSYGDLCWTPLHFAAYNGRLDLVRALLENGADKRIRTWKNDLTFEPNKTAEDLARLQGHPEVADFIRHWK